MAKKRITRGIIILLVIVFCVLLFWGYSEFRSFLSHDEFFGAAENFVTKVDSPLTLENARKDLKFLLPDEASDIYYAHYAQWIAYDFKVKFKAPLEVCKSHALHVIQRYNENEGNPDRKIVLEFTVISEPPRPEGSGPPINIMWFDVHNIKNGFKIGIKGAQQPMIWIDADRNLFYYRLTD